MMGSEALLLGALLCMVGLPLLLLAGAYVGLRAWRSPGGQGLGRARARLNQRLAAGEIEVEEYYERESALRSTEPVARPRRRLL